MTGENREAMRDVSLFCLIGGSAIMKRDYYEVLGIDKNADASAIKKAYRKLAKNIIRIRIKTIRTQNRSLRKSRKHILC